MHSSESATCSKCNIEKPLNDFYKNKNKSNGRDSHCKKCVLKQKKRSYKLNMQKKRIVESFKVTEVGSPDDEMFAYHFSEIVNYLLR